jgi:hypothetical protein
MAGAKQTAHQMDAGKTCEASEQACCELTGQRSFSGFFVCANINKSPGDEF